MLASVGIGRGICLYVLDPPMFRSHKATLSLRKAAELAVLQYCYSSSPVLSYWTPCSQRQTLKYTYTTIMPFFTVVVVTGRRGSWSPSIATFTSILPRDGSLQRL